MIITVTGGTGNSGGATVRKLSERADAAGITEIRAMVRDIEKDSAKALTKLPKVILVKGDFQDTASLEAAVKGADRAFLVSTAGTDQQSENEINFIKACQAVGTVDLVVRISTCSPLIGLDSRGVYARAHAITEKYIADSNAPVVDLSPDWFMDNWGMHAAEAKSESRISMPYGDRPTHGFIHSDDNGGYAAALLTVPSDEVATHVGKRYNISGPDWVTWEHVVKALSKEAGYNIQMNDITWEKLETMFKSWGFPDVLALSLALTFAVMEGTVPPKRSMENYAKGTSAAMAALYTPTVTVEEQAKRLAPLFRRE